MDRDLEKLKTWIVRKRLQGCSVTEICTSAGISRDMFYRWWNRYQAEGYSPEFVGAEKLLFSTLCSGTLGLQGNVDLIIKTAKSRKARYCCPAHRVEYFRRRKRQEKKRIEKAHSVWLFRRDLQLRLEHLQGLQERTSAAITEIQTQLAALPTEGEIQA